MDGLFQAQTIPNLVRRWGTAGDGDNADALLTCTRIRTGKRRSQRIGLQQSRDTRFGMRARHRLTAAATKDCLVAAYVSAWTACRDSGFREAKLNR